LNIPVWICNALSIRAFKVGIQATNLNGHAIAILAEFPIGALHVFAGIKVFALSAITDLPLRALNAIARITVIIGVGITVAALIFRCIAIAGA
jgi:hypothetical protein